MTSKANVIAGKPKIGGAIFRAPLGTALPTDANTPLPAAYVELGYASSDGWARQINKSYESIAAWGGDEVLKSRSEHGVAFSLSLIEDLNENSQTAKWGQAAVATEEATAEHGKQIAVTYKGEDTEPGVWVLDMNDQGKLKRTVFPNAVDTTESFEQKFSDAEVVALPFEMTAYRDEDGTYFYDYSDNGVKVAA